MSRLSCVFLQPLIPLVPTSTVHSLVRLIDTTECESTNKMNEMTLPIWRLLPQEDLPSQASSLSRWEASR